jgi:hypothetical protein
MCSLIRTCDFDFENSDSGLKRDFPPSFSRELKRIDAIGDYRKAQAQIFIGHGVGGTIAGVVHRVGHGARVSQCLFDRICPQVNGTYLAR